MHTLIPTGIRHPRVVVVQLPTAGRKPTWANIENLIQFKFWHFYPLKPADHASARFSEQIMHSPPNPSQSDAPSHKGHRQKISSGDDEELMRGLVAVPLYLIARNKTTMAGCLHRTAASRMWEMINWILGGESIPLLTEH